METTPRTVQEKHEKFNNKINFRRDKSPNPVRDIILTRHVATSRSIIVSLTRATAVVCGIDRPINYIYSLNSLRILLMCVAQETGLSRMDSEVDAAVTVNYCQTKILRTNKKITQLVEALSDELDLFKVCRKC